MPRTAVAAPSPRSDDIIEAMAEMSLQELVVLMLKMRWVIQHDCADCRTPQTSGTRHGYLCPRHWELIKGYPMPTTRDYADES